MGDTQATRLTTLRDLLFRHAFRHFILHRSPELLLTLRSLCWAKSCHHPSETFKAQIEWTALLPLSAMHSCNPNKSLNLPSCLPNNSNSHLSCRVHKGNSWLMNRSWNASEMPNKTNNNHLNSHHLNKDRINSLQSQITITKTSKILNRNCTHRPNLPLTKIWIDVIRMLWKVQRRSSRNILEMNLERSPKAIRVKMINSTVISSLRRMLMRFKVKIFWSLDLAL